MTFRCTMIVEVPGLIDYLEKRQLRKQYEKSKKYVLMWLFKEVDFRKSEPKEDNVFYFKINVQYRAIGYMDWEAFKVTEISGHQTN